TLGLAPGNSARTTTVGGTTSGYSLIGSWNSEMAPPMRITSDSTAAKIGRLTKNCEKFMTHSGGRGCASRTLAESVVVWCGATAGAAPGSGTGRLRHAAVHHLRLECGTDGAVLLLQRGEGVG